MKTGPFPGLSTELSPAGKGASADRLHQLGAQMPQSPLLTPPHPRPGCRPTRATPSLHWDTPASCPPCCPVPRSKHRAGADGIAVPALTPATSCGINLRPAFKTNVPSGGKPDAKLHTAFEKMTIQRQAVTKQKRVKSPPQGPQGVCAAGGQQRGWWSEPAQRFPRQPLPAGPGRSRGSEAAAAKGLNHASSPAPPACYWKAENRMLNIQTHTHPGHF